jgi:hypothetical protein
LFEFEVLKISGPLACVDHSLMKYVNLTYTESTAFDGDKHGVQFYRKRVARIMYEAGIYLYMNTSRSNSRVGSAALLSAGWAAASSKQSIHESTCGVA